MYHGRTLTSKVPLVDVLNAIQVCPPPPPGGAERADITRGFWSPIPPPSSVALPDGSAGGSLRDEIFFFC